MGYAYMSIEFRKVSDFHRGILFALLKDAYSFDCRYEQYCSSDWQIFDDFFFDNLQIADKCGFITTKNEEAIGFVSWDPRSMPESAQIGFNCIASKHKGNGYGNMQLQEAVNRISQNDVRKNIVTTNDDLIPAQRMYESVGFTREKRRKQNIIDFVGEHIDYVYVLCDSQSFIRKQPIITITPNFNFAGCCEEAMMLYQKAFDATIGCLLRYFEANPSDWDKELTDVQRNYIYHGELCIGNQRIMMCDNMDVELVKSTALSLTVTFDTKEEVKKAYDILKEGSVTIYPIHSTSYSSCMVVFIDKFGFRWGLMTEQTQR